MARTANDVGQRIEQLLEGVPAGPARRCAEDLVGLLVEMYGEGLTRVVGLLRERSPELVARLAEDDVVESLLLLHDLHPLDVDQRIQRALDRVRPYLGSHAGGVEYLGVDGQGVARLRLAGNCQGCPSSAVTVRTAIEGAVREAAPEVTEVAVAGMTEPGLLQVGMGPPPGWSPLPEPGPPGRQPTTTVVDGVPVLVCSVRGTSYAYQNTCGGCGSALDSAAVDGSVLTCPSCRRRFDLRLAGRGLDDEHHLAPLPLLSDSHGTRVAVPRPVAS